MAPETFTHRGVTPPDFIETHCLYQDSVSTSLILVGVPRLWNDTIAAHRHQVRDAILDATAALVASTVCCR